MIILILTFFHHYVYYICTLDYVQYLYSCMYFIERYENKIEIEIEIEYMYLYFIFSYSLFKKNARPCKNAAMLFQ